MAELLTLPPFRRFRLDIVRDQDWSDPMPQILDNGVAFDCTGKNLELHILPTFDNDTLLLLASTAGGEITWEDITLGKPQVFVPRGTVRAALPKSPPSGWAYFLLLKESTFYTEVYRGPCYVADGNTDAS